MKIYLVKTTDQAKKLGVIITDLGCIPHEGHEFLVTEERLKVLEGDNAFKATFVKGVEVIGETFENDENVELDVDLDEEAEPVVEEAKPKKASKKKEDK